MLALLGTCIETARYTACAGSGTEILRTGTEALLTEYSRPLYDHYGLFFLESTGEPFEKVIASYVGDGLDGRAGIMDFLGGELEGLQLKKKTLVGDEEAAALQEEITAYMERYVTGSMLQKLLKKLNLFSGSEEKAEQIEKTVEEEREDKKLDERILRLMQLVDGVRISGSGGVSVGSYFAKKFATKKEYTGADFGVQESKVWGAMKRRIDRTPSKWKEMGPDFLTKVKNVREATEKAISEGERLRQECGGAKHSDMAARVIQGLPSLEGNRRVLEKTEELLTDSTLTDKERRKSLKEVWEDYDTWSLSFDYSGIDSAGGEEASPLKALGDVIGSGLLHLVCKKEISKKAMKKADRYAAYYKQEGNEESDCTDRLERFAKDEEAKLGGAVGELGAYAMNEFSLDAYITKMFPSYIAEAGSGMSAFGGDDTAVAGNGVGAAPMAAGMSPMAAGSGVGAASPADDGITPAGETKGKWKRTLDYGWEYVVSGKKSDEDNLESVLSRILLLRTVTNFIAIIADGKKRAEAFAAAVAVVGLIGLPFLIKFTQTLILLAWSFVESMTDVAALLQEKHVPLVKTSGQIRTTFPELFLLTKEAITGRAALYPDARESSFGYREYLYAFMAMTPSSLRRYRVMDLIESDMKKNGYDSFDFGRCVFDLKVEAGFRFPARFFRLPGIERILNRELNGYEYRCVIRAGYL